MPVDPRKTRKILVIHGVQTGDDDDLNQHETIRDLVTDRLNGLSVDFETDIYKYENTNDKAQESYRQILKLFVDNIVGKKVVDLTADLVGDVLLALKDGSTAQKIREGLIKRIIEEYEKGNPLYIVAHSLGSIYAFDAVNELMKKDGYFDRNSRKTWPVQAMVTMGSPLGLSMFNRNKVVELGAGRHFFRWINYWDRTDPVVSGSFYGKPQQGYNIVETFSSDADKTGWFIQDKVVDVGKAWLRAHVGYWEHPGVGDDLAALITS